MKNLIVTEKQLDVIKNSCELYGRIQIGQFKGFAEIVTQTGFSGFGMRVQPERKEDQTDEDYKEWREALYRKDEIVSNAIEGAVNGIYRNAYNWDAKPRTDESNIALDIWAVLEGRREDGFHMGSEPLVKVKDLET